VHDGHRLTILSSASVTLGMIPDELLHQKPIDLRHKCERDCKAPCRAKRN
jgi:hypothetical protein